MTDEAYGPAPADGTIADRDQAEGYLARVCFKTGPPRLVGLELEWTVHHRDQPTRPITTEPLSTALGEHAPRTLCPTSPQAPLPGGGLVTVEPGGQVEISTPPRDSLAELARTTTEDIARLRQLLGAYRLGLGDQGTDPYRPPRRILRTARYAAMERAFDRIGPAGREMMCATASVQVCLDAGTPGQAPLRWTAAHALGPVLLALFANSTRSAGRDTGWASGRMRTWYRTDPARTLPPLLPTDPAGYQDPVHSWVRRVLDTPLLCLRRQGTDWTAPAGVTFADWIAGALPDPPSHGDLDYHLSTLFPPVRARGHLELRYLDGQRADNETPGTGWLAPLAMLTALFARETTLASAVELVAPVANEWTTAARAGLTAPELATAAAKLVDLSSNALADTDLSPATITTVADDLAYRLKRAQEGTPR